MGIDVKRETEHGEQENQVLDPGGVFPTLLNRCRVSQTHLLQYINPYGDTVFNQLQIPKLLEELSDLMRFAESDRERAFLKAVLELVDHARNQIHTYVKFYGD